MDIKELYKRKVIRGIKDEKLTIKFIENYAWLILTIILIVNLQYLPILLTSEIAIFAVIGCILVTIFIVYNYLEVSYIIRFRSDYIIIENKLKKRTVIDMKKSPKIYLTSKQDKVYVHTRYGGRMQTVNWKELRIRDRINEMVINTKFISNKKISQIIDNLELEDDEDIIEEKYVNKNGVEGITYTSHVEFKINQEIREKQKDVNSVLKTKAVICLIVFIICYFIAGIVKTETGDITNLFMTIASFAAILGVIFVIQIIDNKVLERRKAKRR